MSGILHQSAMALAAVAELQTIGCEVLSVRAAAINHCAQIWIARPEPLLAWCDARPQSDRPLTLAGGGIVLHECIVLWPRGPQLAAERSAA